MRREFVLVVLGIICISTLSSMLSGYVQIETDKVLLDTVVGAVGAGNFSYWQLGHTGPLLVELTSLTGDADLYVADHLRPSYEIDRNNFSSTSCGHDIVNVAADFPRPIGIGIFGHWSHNLSKYSIQVFLDTSEILNEEKLVTIERAHRTRAKTETEKKTMNMINQKLDDSNNPRFFRFLNLIDMIFEIVML